TLDAIEAVAGVFRPKAEDPATAPMWLDTLDLISSLVDKSLVRPQFGRSGLRGRGEEPDAAASPRSEPRFSMLWTIREYGLDRLARSGEEQAIRRSHAQFFLGLAEEALPFLRGSRQA